ncbi:MAG: hypothetical protein HYX35_04840 [Proteobacteria bacterium]|nr:hypothetical protein [Pseudomonadota bacterium]
MKKYLSSKEWIQEFQEFMSTEPIDPSEGVSQQILSQVHADLTPSAGKVFLRLSLIHAVVGAITLLFCPQFGISPLGGMGLMSLFMNWGEQACMLGCGAVFMGASFLVASCVLRVEEVRVIRKTELLQVGALGLLSLGIFLCTGLGVVFGLGLFWLLGSLIGGLATLEAGWALRNWFNSHFRYS